MFVRHEKAPHGLWTEINGRPLRGANGDVLGGVIVCRDITELKEEEFFRAGQSRVLEMIAADAPLADVLTSLVLLMEGQAEGLRCSILLLNRDGKHVRHGAAPNLPEAYVKAVNGAPIGPRNGSCGTAMYRRRPVVVTDVMTDPLWADYRELAKICGLRACWSTPILSAQGDVLGSFAMYRQEKRGPLPEETRLTQIATHIAGIAIERQRQQEILREREARINLAAESADLAFWVLYPEQNTAWMSEKGRLIYGFDSNLPLTCDLILSRVHPDERADVKAAYDRACALSGTFESEHRLLLPYGKTRWVIMRGRCLKDEEGNLLETIGVTIDVSAQKQADLQLQHQREEMAHRNRVALMGEMTASFAHELNQPLTAIANNASAARRFLERGNIDPALLQQLLQDMVADSQRAGEVIRGIRSLVRKETSVHTLLDLNAMITDTVRLVSSDVLSRESVVTTELDPQLPQVKARSVQIQQVLLNLIMNALDAVEGLPPAERRIIISTRSDKGDVVEVSVRDFGTGLPKDRPDKVFDHFFSTKQKGMGMGLTIVRSIIEAHGGTIVAENAPDRGARIIVRLPAVRGQTTNDSRCMSDPNQADDREVCLVDDDPSVLNSMHYLLASDGIKVRTFNKAEDFLDSRQREPRASGRDRYLDGWGHRPGSPGASLRHFAQDACHRHYRARGSGRACHRDGHRPGCLFHEAVQRRKIHRGGSRRSQSKQEITNCRNERRGLRYDISKPSVRMEMQSQSLQRSRLLRF